MKRLIFCGILILLPSGCAEPVMGWGLSFQTEGLPPAAPMTAEKLRELGGAYWDEDGGKVLYLTFDAGYENGFTKEILDVLQELQVPAAFFLTGDYLSREPDLVRRMTAEGHIVGNHTMTHPDMTAVDAEKFQAELQGLEEKYPAEAPIEAVRGDALAVIHGLLRPAKPEQRADGQYAVDHRHKQAHT